MAEGGSAGAELSPPTLLGVGEWLPAVHKPPPPVSALRILLYATTQQKALVGAGLLGAMLCGAVFPAFSIIFGGLIQTASTTPPDRIESAVAGWVKLLLVAGGAAFVGAFVMSYCMTSSGKEYRKTLEGMLPPQHAVKADLQAVEEAVGLQGGLLVMHGGTVLFSYATAFWYCWRLALVLLSVSPLLLLSGAVMVKTAAGSDARNASAYTAASTLAAEVFDGLRTVTSLPGAGTTLRRRHTTLVDEALVSVRYSKFIVGAGIGFTLATLFSSYAIGMFYASKLTGKGLHGLQDVFAAFCCTLVGSICLGQAFTPLGAVSVARSAAARVFAELPAEDSKKEEEEEEEDAPSSLSLRAVTFRYPTGPPVLTDMSLELPLGGSFVAVVGPSGAGKTTLLRLLLGEDTPEPVLFRTVEGGHLVPRPVAEAAEKLYREWDGEEDVEAVLPRIAVPVGLGGDWEGEAWVRFHPEEGVGFRFPVPVGCDVLELRRDAVTGEWTAPPYALPLSASRILEAARGRRVEVPLAIGLCVADLETNQLDVGKPGWLRVTTTKNGSVRAGSRKGWRHVRQEAAAEGSAYLSGGQRQRVAVTAALAGDPTLLVLDEPTSAQDRSGELAMQAAIADCRTRGTSVLAVTHRLQTVVNADEIVVLGTGGQVVERGTHAALMAADGVYRSMWLAQGLQEEKEGEEEEEKGAMEEDEGVLSPSTEPGPFVAVDVDAPFVDDDAAPPAPAAPPSPFHNVRYCVREGGWLRHALPGCFASAVSGAVYPVYAWCLGRAVDALSAGGGSQVHIWCVVFAAIGVAGFLSAVVQSGCLAACGEVAAAAVRKRLFPFSADGAAAALVATATSLGGVLQAVACGATCLAFSLTHQAELTLYCLPFAPLRALAGVLGPYRWGGSTGSGIRSALASGLSQIALFAVGAVALYRGAQLMSAGEALFPDVLGVAMQMTTGCVGIGEALAGSSPPPEEGCPATFPSSPLPEGDAASPAPFPSLVAFENVKYRILNGFNLTLDVSAGHKTVLVGPPGCGKSTVLDLLLGRGDVVEGCVSTDAGTLRSGVGFVDQHPVVFRSLGLRENIGLGKVDATQEEIDAAAVKAGVDLERWGTDLSGGQKQKVALARALLGRPRLLVLDEATSGLDPQSSLLFDSAVAASGAAVVSAVHKLSSVPCDDKTIVAVLRAGRVVETGSPGALLSKPCGEYRALHALYHCGVSSSGGALSAGRGLVFSSPSSSSLGGSLLSPVDASLLPRNPLHEHPTSPY